MNYQLMPKGHGQKFGSTLVNQTPVYARKVRKKKKHSYRVGKGKDVKWI